MAAVSSCAPSPSRPSTMRAFLARRARVGAVVLAPPVVAASSARAPAAAAPSPAGPSRRQGRRRRCSAAGAEAAATPESSERGAKQQQQHQPRQHNFDAEAERQAAVDAARDAFRGARESALEKNAALAARLKGKLILAPLTRGGNLPFRRLCADFGADASMSEMIFARSLVGRGGGGRGVSGAEKTRLRRAPGEALFGVQIATNEIREGVAAAKMAAEAGACWLDLNCGCPVYEATRRGLGAALLRKPTKLARLVAGLVEESPLPVTVKIRTGPGEASVNAPFVAALLEAAGAAAVTIHGRTMEQRYRKAADWGIIREVARQRIADAAASSSASAPPVPIIGNGDVLTWYELEQRGIYLGGGGPGDRGRGATEHADADADDGGADGGAGLVHAAMVGRGALVKPWLWTEARERRELALAAEERVGVYRRLASHMRDYFGDDEKGRKKAWYFLPWHFNFFHRYRSFPREQFGARSLESPLLSMRVPLWDEGAESEGAEGVPPLERLLRCEHERAHEEMAALLWDSGSDAEAAGALERLSREKVRDWERELYEDEEAAAAEGGGAGRGRRDAREDGGGGDKEEVEG